MPVTDPYSQYQQNQLKTQTPGKLLLMAYDAAIRFAQTAAEKMKEGKLYEQSANIIKAQNIVLELMSSLDLSKDRQLAAGLADLYTYIFDRLTQANIRDDLKALEEATGVMSELRAAWAEAELSLRTGGAARPADSRAAA